MTRRAALVVAALLAVLGLLAAGCGTAPAPPGPAAVRPVPAGTTVLPPGVGAGPEDTTCDPTASLRPTGPPSPVPAPDGRAPVSSLERIARDGVLVVGVDQNTPPFGARDSASGTLTGSDISLARAVAGALLGTDTKIQFRTESSAQRIPNLTSGTKPVDIVVQTLTATCERREQIEFSTSYFVARQKLLVPTTSDVRSLDDLGAGPGRPARRVCTIASTTAVRSIQSTPSHPIAVTVPENNDCLVLLQQGQVDGIVTDDTILAGFRDQDPRLKILDAAIGPGEPYVIGVARHRADLPCPPGQEGPLCPNNEALVRFVNGVLDGLRTGGPDGRLAAIYAPAAVPPGTRVAPPAARYRG